MEPVSRPTLTPRQGVAVATALVAAAASAAWWFLDDRFYEFRGAKAAAVVVGYDEHGAEISGAYHVMLIARVHSATGLRRDLWAVFSEEAVSIYGYRMYGVDAMYEPQIDVSATIDGERVQLRDGRFLAPSSPDALRRNAVAWHGRWGDPVQVLTKFLIATGNERAGGDAGESFTKDVFRRWIASRRPR